MGNRAEEDTLPVGGFKVGQRVERPRNVYEPDSPLRAGTVTRRYTDLPHYDELYEVVWDTENGEPIEPLFCVGYLRHGLRLR